MAPRGWHWRGYLPHFDGGAVAQTVTFRLADSLPRWLVEQERPDRAAGYHAPDDAELDRGRGAAWLGRPAVADLMSASLQWDDGRRYQLHAWVVMPNHVHVLFTPLPDWALNRIVHTWKSWTAHQANSLLGRQGSFWHEDYYDRYVRNARHFHAEAHYIENNPVGAGLCDRPHEWRWSSAAGRAAVERADGLGE